VSLSRPTAGARWKGNMCLYAKGVKRNVKDMMEDSVLMCLITNQYRQGVCWFMVLFAGNKNCVCYVVFWLLWKSLSVFAQLVVSHLDGSSRGCGGDSDMLGNVSRSCKLQPI